MKELKCPNCRGTLSPVADEDGSYFCPHCGAQFETTDKTVHNVHFTYENKTETKKEENRFVLRQREQDFKERKYDDARNDEEKKRVSSIMKVIIPILLAILVAIVGVVLFYCSHFGEIKIDNSSDCFIDIPFSSAQQLLADKGFNNIELNCISDLRNKDATEDGIVTAISIDGQTSFRGNAWFKRDATVVITYHALDPNRLDEIQIPESNEKLTGVNYEDVQKQLEIAGFRNIELNCICDLRKRDAEKDGIVTVVSINGKTAFSSDSWFERNATIIITYHTLDPDQQDEVQVYRSADSLTGENYITVRNLFKDYGFTEIILVPQSDITLLKSEYQDGEVFKVSINGVDSFSKNDWFTRDSVVRINVHATSKTAELINNEGKIQLPDRLSSYNGELYSEISDKLNSLHFSNIVLKPLNDLGPDDKNIGKVESVTIDGRNDCKKGEYYSPDAEIIITYHDVKSEWIETILIEKDESYYVEKQYDKVMEMFSDMGFTNIKLVPSEDLKNESKVGKVISVSINGNENFKKGQRFSINAAVVIAYHSLEPSSIILNFDIYWAFGILKEDDAEALAQKFKDIGFTNVILKPLNDLETGDKKDGKVESVTIDGNTEFKKGDCFYSDMEIAITYHNAG